MNRMFKTLWSTHLQQYVVTHEKTCMNGKPAKSVAVALLGAALLLGSGGASATYEEPGKIGKDMAQTWETPEYNWSMVTDDEGTVGSMWSLKAMNASSAYALGFHGQGVKVGVMDSGVLMSHSDLSGERFHATHVTGTYGSSGHRYIQYYGRTFSGESRPTGDYTEGETYDFTGDWIKDVNDSHGTRVTASLAANRDGEGMHGVAWGSEIYSLNSGGSDKTNHGPFLDYDFFKTSYKTAVDQGVKIINNSFGTNIKRDVRKLKRYKKKENRPVSYSYTESGLKLDTVADVEYEYFLFKNLYQDKKSWLDGAWEAVKGTDVIQSMAAGNNWRNNPFHRGMYPYFHPEAEGNWISNSGLTKDDELVDGVLHPLEGKYRALDERLYPAGYDNKVKKAQGFNRPGFAKYWSLVNEGSYGATASVSDEGEAIFGSMGGTSMATPLSSGAFAVLSSRYPEMTGKQIREVLFSTAKHTNDDGSTMKGWTAPEGEVDVKMGWGLPDLKAGMFGPKQFFSLSHFNYELNGVDVWQNPIGETALKQREREDKAWLASVTDDGTLTGNVLASKGGDYKLDTEEGVPIYGLDTDPLVRAGEKVTLRLVEAGNAEKWRQEYFDARAKDIREKMANDHYRASLTKSGPGTLVLATTAPSTYTGGTTVKAGELYGFSHSFGQAPIVIEGGAFGVLAQFNDTTVTRQGVLDGSTATHLADILVKDGGTLNVMVSGDQVDTYAKHVVLEKGAKVGLATLDQSATGASQSVAAKLRENGGSITARLIADDGIENHTDLGALTQPDYVFLESSVAVDGNALTVKVNALPPEKMIDNLTDIITTANEGRVAEALFRDAKDDPTRLDPLVLADKAALKALIAAPADTTFNNVMNARLLNATRLADTVLDGTVDRQAQEGKLTVWMTALADQGDVTFDDLKTDNTQYGTLIGVETPVNGVTVGGFFGAGHSKFDTDGHAKISGRDLHAGIYAKTALDKIGVKAGLAYSHLDHEVDNAAKSSAKANLTQLFGEVSYTVTEGVAPYAGMDWVHALNKDVETDMNRKADKQDVFATNVGVRCELPVSLKGVDLKLTGDLGWTHFFGDTTPTTQVNVGTHVVAVEGGKLKDVGNVSVGVSAQLTPVFNVGLAYQGNFGQGIKSNGLKATLNYAF